MGNGRRRRPRRSVNEARMPDWQQLVRQRLSGPAPDATEKDEVHLWALSALTFRGGRGERARRLSFLESSLPWLFALSCFSFCRSWSSSSTGLRPMRVPCFIRGRANRSGASGWWLAGSWCRGLLVDRRAGISSDFAGASSTRRCDSLRLRWSSDGRREVRRESGLVQGMTVPGAG